MPEEEFPFFDRVQEGKTDKILSRVLKEGNFGKERGVYKNRGTNYLLNKTRSFFGHICKSADLVTVFPKQVWHQYKSTIVGGFKMVFVDLKIKLSGKRR